MALHAAVFLLTWSGLVFEIGLTRIYSATIWYHFAFVAVSVALLGWGLGGFVLHLLRRHVTPSLDLAAMFAVLYGVAVGVCLGVLVRFPFEIERLPLYFLAPLLPFFLAGMTLALVFQLHRHATATLYFADLLGASLGALAVTALLQAFGGETTLLLAALAPFVSAALLSTRYRRASLVLLAVTGLVAALNEPWGLLRVTPGTLKAMRRHMDETPGTRATQTGWNAYSRIDAVEGFPPPNLARLYIDSDAWTNALAWDGSVESIAEARDWFRAFPFRLAPPGAETLVIGPGGGSDVLVALGSGSRRVTAVEMNPLMLEFVRHYGQRAGHLYDRPDVEVIESEGRNFISRTDRRFDVIFLGFVDTWASVASGGLSLSENYLYTTEAFRSYFDRLTDDGMLVILRWRLDLPRLVSNSVALLGAQQASTRVAALVEVRDAPDDPAQMLFMLRKRPFTEAERTLMHEWDLATPLVVPGRYAEPPYDDLFSGRKSLAEVNAESVYRSDPVYDNSPFYFAIEKPWGIPYRMRQALSALVTPVLVLLGGFVLLGKPRGTRVMPYAASVVYFACLGAGFIAVELALLQHLTLLLGHPIFTLSLLLSTILAAGGFGSAISARVNPRWACWTVAGLSAVAAFGLPHFVPLVMPLSLTARLLIAVAVIVPLGLAMGIPFPRGLAATGERSLPPPPFYWGLNGVMSVIGSVGTVVLALVAGFQVAMLAGAACYVVAGLVSGVLMPSRLGHGAVAH